MKDQKKKNVVSKTLVKHGRKFAVASGVATAATTTALIVESEKHKHEAGQSPVQHLKISQAVSGTVTQGANGNDISAAQNFLTQLSTPNNFGKSKVSEATDTYLSAQANNFIPKAGASGTLTVSPSSVSTGVTAPVGSTTALYYIANGTVTFGSGTNAVVVTFTNEPIFSGKTYSVANNNISAIGNPAPNTFTTSIDQENLDKVTQVTAVHQDVFGAATNTQASNYEAKDNGGAVVSGVSITAVTVTPTTQPALATGGYSITATATITSGTLTKQLATTWTSTTYNWSMFPSTLFDNITFSGDTKNITLNNVPAAPAGTKIQYKIDNGAFTDLSGNTITNSAFNLSSVSFQLATTTTGNTINGSVITKTFNPTPSATFKKAVDVSTLKNAANTFAFAGTSKALTFTHPTLDNNADITYTLTLGSNPTNKGGTISGNILSNKAALTQTTYSYTLLPANTGVALYDGNTAAPASGVNGTAAGSFTGLADPKLTGVTKWILPALDAPTATVTGATSKQAQATIDTKNVPATAVTWTYELYSGTTAVTIGGASVPANMDLNALNTFLTNNNIYNANATAAGSYAFDTIKATATAVATGKFEFDNAQPTQVFNSVGANVSTTTKVIDASVANNAINAGDIAVKQSKGMTFTEPGTLATAGMQAVYSITTSLPASNGLTKNGAALYGSKANAEAFLAANNAWNYGTNSWDITKVDVYAVGANGYSVDGQVGNGSSSMTPNASKTLFDSTKLPAGFVKVLDESAQATDVTNAFKITNPSNTATNQVWDAAAATTITKLINGGYTVQYALGTTTNPTNWQSVATAADLPKTGFDSDKSKRFLQIRLTPKTADYKLNTGTEKIIDITTGSNIRNIKTSVDVSGIAFGHDTAMWGTNSKTAGTPTQTLASITDTFINSNLEIRYSLNDFAGTTTGANNFGVPATTPSSLTLSDLQALFNGTADGNLWNQANNVWAGNIKAKVALKSTATATDFAVTGDTSKVVFDPTNATLPTKFVDPTRTSTALSNNTSMQTYFGGIKVTGLHNAPTWTNVPALSPADQAAYNVEYLVGNYADVTAASGATTWSATFPTAATALDVTHANRHVFVRLSPKAGYVFSSNANASGKQIFDITTSSTIQSVKTSIDHLPNYAGWLANKLVFTGDTSNGQTTVTDNNTTTTSLVGAAVEYSDDNFGSHKWTEAQLKTELAKGFGKVQIRTIKARLIPTDGAKYVVTDKNGLVDITGFKSFTDVTAAIADLNNGQNQIDVHGTVGKGIQIIPKGNLISSTLKGLGMILQFSTDNKTTWTNFVGKTGAPTANNGFVQPPGATTEYQEVVPFNSGMTLDFRIVPQFQDDTTTPYTKGVSDNADVRSTDLKVKTNDPLAASTGTIFNWNLQSLPVLVYTDSAVITTELGVALSGTTHDIATAAALIQTKIKDYLDGKLTAKPSTKNVQPSGKQWDATLGFSKFTQIGYQVSFTSASKHGAMSDYLLTETQFKQWLAGTLPAAQSVWQITLSKMVPLPAGLETMDWNNIDMATFKAGWISTDIEYTVSDVKLVNLPSTSLKRWFDMTSYLNRLKNIAYDGATNALTTPTGDSVTGIQTELNNLAGAGSFTIRTSATKNGAAYDFTGTNGVNGLISEINHNFELGYQIKAGTNFISSLQATPTTTDATIEWDSSKKAATLLKFVHVNPDDLKTLVFTGDTHHMAYTPKPELTNANAMGVMGSGAGTSQKVEIYAQLGSAVTTANRSWMPLDMLMDYMNGTLSASKQYGSNASVTVQSIFGSPTPAALAFDGTWGRDAISLQYRPLTGYAIDAKGQTTNQNATRQPDVTAVKRWLDVSGLITSDTGAANGIKVIAKSTTTDSWWDETKTTWTDNKSWTHYVDDTNFDLSAHAQYQQLKVKIQYNWVASGAAPDPTKWSDTIPTALTNPAASRKLWIHYVSDGTKYGTSEDVVVSDSQAKDITTNSGITNILTKVDVTTADLTKIKFTGTARVFTEDKTTANIPTNTEVRYSLTDFESPTSADTNVAGRAKAALAKMGIQPGTPPFTAYKASMTFAELTTFVNALTTAQAQPNTAGYTDMWRGLLKARLIANNGFTITKADDIAKRVNINVDALYSTRDLYPIKNLMHYDQTGASAGIGLIGTKDIQDAVRVVIPNAIYDFYHNKGLELQYTLDGVASANGTQIKPNASWTNAPVTNKAANKVNGVSLPTAAHGFDVTLTSLTTIGTGATSLSHSFIAFRFVPTKQDDGTAITAPAATADLNTWYDLAKTKLFETNNSYTNLGSMAYNLQPADGYSIDTSQIPKQVHVQDLLVPANSPVGAQAVINAKGTTHLADIVDADINAVRIGIDPLNTDKTADDMVHLMYSIDTTDGDFLDGDGTKPKALWLMEKDFEDYLNGNLRIAQGGSGLQVTNSANGNKVVAPSVLTNTLLTGRKFKVGDTFAPDYTKIDTQSGTFGSAGRKNSAFVKWSNLNEDYSENRLFMPSDLSIYPLKYDGTTFRRWFDGNYYNQQLTKVEIAGTTKSDGNASGSYTFDYSKVQDVAPAELAKLGLKVQYSFDNATWQDNTLDFSKATWIQQVARKIYARVVPAAFTNTTAITQGGDAHTDNGLFVDYAKANHPYAEMNTTVKKANSNEFMFKTYLNIDSAPLATLEIKGNSLILDANTLEEATVDNNVEKFNAVEIQYLYNGIWYNKADLLAKLTAVRTAGTASPAAAAALKMPTDFVNGNVHARFKVSDVNNYTIKDEVAANPNANAANKTDVTSPDKNIVTTNFKTFVNIWDVQDKSTNDFAQTLVGANNVKGQAAVITLTGSVNKASGSFALPGTQYANWITSNHLRLQWSIKDNPNQAFPSADWNDITAPAALPQFMKDTRLDPTSKRLSIRFVPAVGFEDKVVPSSFLSNGTTQNVQEIIIDTSQLKFAIDADANALKAIAISGDSQNMTVDTDPFLKAKLATTPTPGYTGPAYATVSGVPYFYTVDATGQEVRMNEADANTFISTTAKLNVQFKAVQTRRTNQFVDPYTSKPVLYGDEVIFYNFADLQKAIQSGNFNFDKSTLQVAWYVGEKTNFTLDSKAQNGANPIWVSPTNLSNLKNTVYTDDVFVLTSTSLAVSGNNLKLQVPAPTQDVNTGPQYYDPATKTSSAKKATDVLTPTFLGTLGLKLQYNWTALNGNPDPAKWSDTAPDGSATQVAAIGVDQKLNGTKDYWIRYAPVDQTKTKLASATAGKEEQITKINVAKVKLAIPFTGTSITDILKQITDAAIEGTTYDFKFSTGKELPVIGQSADFATVNKVHGHIQYSIDNKFWGDSIADAFTGLPDHGDHYGNGVQGFDRDRGDKLYIRYVYEETVGNVAPADSTNWVYTDSTGTEISLAQLATKAFDITNLIQPIYIDKSLKLLTGQNSIVPTVPANSAALLNPNGQPDFAGVTWKDLANYGLFKPRFSVGSNDRVANFNYMWYDGFLRDAAATPSYLFKMGTNPYDPKDVIIPADDYNAFAPRHTKFKFQVYTTTKGWTDITNLKDLTRGSNHQYFRVQLVADQNYYLGSKGAGFTIPTKFMDNSTPTSAGQSIPSQEWQKDYSVTIELLTSNYSLPTANQTQFIGWDSTQTFDPSKLIAGKNYPDNIPDGQPSGLFKTIDSTGNHIPAMSGTLKDIYLNLLNGSTALDFTNANLDERKEYVVEWSVTDASGTDIPWLDSAGGAFAGWHPAVANTTAQKTFSVTAPSSTVPWYGSYPVSLKNGDIVKLRLRARDGFVISKDNLAKPTVGLPANTKDGGYDAASKTSWWSHELTMTPVSGLTNEIPVPNDFALFDSAHLIDLGGNPITENTNYPSVKFSGNEGTGTISITNRGTMATPHFHYEAAVLYPFINQATYNAYVKSQDIDPVTGQPRNPNAGVAVILDKNQFSFDPAQTGYSLKTIAEQIQDYQSNTPSAPFYTSPNAGKSFVSDGLPGPANKAATNWKNKVNWVDPSTIKDLHVGDIVFFRLVADTNYGFKWEDTLNNTFTDILYPKPKTFDAFGTVPYADPTSPSATDPAFGFNKNEGVTPVIVRGLTVRPQFDVSSLQLVNDTDPAKNINGSGNNITLNNVPQGSDAWVWQYSPSGQNKWLDYNQSLPASVKNGDKYDFRAGPKNQAYQLDPTYNNTIVTLTVSNLAEPLDAAGIARPVIVFGGYEGVGTIASITEAAPGVNPWSKPTATEPLGRPLLGSQAGMTPTGTELKWQYQVYDSDPTGLSANSLASIKWIDQLPTNLKHGQYIRMRVGSTDPDKVALVNRANFVYSQNPNYTGTPNLIQAQDSWFEVKDLKVNPKNIDYDITYNGWISKTTVSVQPKADNLDVRAVTIEYSFDKGATWWDPNSSKGPFPGSQAQTAQAYIDELKKKLTNNDVIKIRVKANADFILDVNDDDKANGLHVEKDTNGITHMWRDSWDTKVTGLLRWLDVDNVEIQPLTYTNMDTTHVTVDPTTGALKPVDPNVNNGNQVGVWDGFAKTNPPVFGKLNTIIDSTKSQTDPLNNGSKYQDTAVGYRYVVKRIDPATGYALPDEVSNTYDLTTTGNEPSGLSIGDTVYLELVSKDKSIQLSSNRRVQIKISNLDTVIDEPVQDPNFTFVGKSGQGTIANIAIPPLRTKWVYQILTPQVPPLVDSTGNTILDVNGNPTYPALDAGYKYYDQSQPLPTIDPNLKHAQPNLTEWAEEAPANLKNGDYVIALLVPTQVGGGLVVQNLSYPDPATGKGQNIIPISKKWNLVAGLSERIDLSKYHFQYFDDKNPYNPTLVPDAQNPVNYAFKLFGTQEGQAELKINAPIYIDPNSADYQKHKNEQLVDKSGIKIPDAYAQVLQWEFAISSSPEETTDLRYSPTLPTGLVNGQYIHVRMGAKPQIGAQADSITVTGFTPYSFKIDGLTSPASITSKVITLLGITIGGLATLGIATGLIIFLRKRRRKLHFSGKI